MTFNDITRLIPICVLSCRNFGHDNKAECGFALPLLVWFVCFPKFSKLRYGLFSALGFRNAYTAAVKMCTTTATRLIKNSRNSII